MSQRTTTKRFVAGARCPECKEMDTTVCYYQDQVFVRECVECGFVERIAYDDDTDAGKNDADKKEPKSKISPAQVIKITEL